MIPLRFLALLLLLAAQLTQQASAGLFDDDEARARVERVRADLTAVSQRVDEAAKNQVDFANQVEDIRTEIARIRGQIEVLSNGFESTQKRQQDFYVDLDNRLRKIETLASDRPDGVLSSDPDAEARDYETALSSIKARKFADAVVGLVTFTRTYPKSSQLPSAYFWAGYGYMQIKEPAKSAEMYGKVASGWPNDPKAPDALLEQASSLEAAGDYKNARTALQALVDKYPASEAARKAKVKLKTTKRK